MNDMLIPFATPSRKSFAPTSGHRATVIAEITPFRLLSVFIFK
jgi:hypothetical protein